MMSEEDNGGYYKMTGKTLMEDVSKASREVFKEGKAGERGANQLEKASREAFADIKAGRG